MQILSDQYSGSESKHARSGAVSLLAVYESNGAGAVLHDCLGSDDDEVEWSRVATHSCWSNSPFKRVFDFVFAFIAVVLFAPVMLMTALAVKLSSRGPILFKQTRVSKAGSQFTIYKFRSMRVERDAEGPCVTKAGDSRLTCIGGTLRRFKLDELPQLFNVLKGDMSIVGPRPKVPHHQTYELRFRPGITGAASLAFRNEEELLHRLPSEALDAYQVHVLMPLKATLDRRYM
ncbi:MAG: sugar transferase, partial [Acidobacteriaceae bacterium]|nr:sugar transferase [Acidobacteriaceae bacterium]